MGKLKAESVRHHVVGSVLFVGVVVAWAGLTATAGTVRTDAPVPAVDAPASAGHAPAAAAHAPTALKIDAPAAPVTLIDINSASRAQLKTLPGIGDAEVNKIIAARPYLSKVHLVSDAGLPIGVYLSIRRQIVAVQNPEARAKLKTLASAQQAPPR